jgi:hypothetical protein
LTGSSSRAFSERGRLLDGERVLEEHGEERDPLAVVEPAGIGDAQGQIGEPLRLAAVDGHDVELRHVRIERTRLRLAVPFGHAGLADEGQALSRRG